MTSFDYFILFIKSPSLSLCPTPFSLSTHSTHTFCNSFSPLPTRFSNLHVGDAHLHSESASENGVENRYKTRQHCYTRLTGDVITSVVQNYVGQSIKMQYKL
uniref:Uncharacterized protein n=1 Tax=Cacopsylla melanoneura TaxID=428564 RepID=A0A8D9F3L8_9HEMI